MRLENLFTLIKDYSIKDKILIIRAYEFASKVHGGVIRKSGEPYITHPLSVACILAEMHADADTIAAGLLHDTIEDGENITKEMIEEFFNPTIALLVDGVTKMKKVEFDNDKELTDEANTRKIIEGITQDVRIFIVKLADRLHNMRTLKFHKREKQIEIALETMEIFVPFANLIGEYAIQLELEDLSFKYCDPKNYKNTIAIKEEVENKYRKQIDEILCSMAQQLNSNDLSFGVRVKYKNIYDIHRRLKQTNNVYDIHDLVSIKLMVDDIEDCYKVKEQIEKMYQTVPLREKDYIRQPKTNLYSALHTVIKTYDDLYIQVQIATPEMYKINQYGLTAYWKLMNKLHMVNPAEEMNQDIKKFQFFELLQELSTLNISNDLYNKEVREDLLQERIYVYTPKHEIIELPKGATPVDFAYKIHTDLGDTLIACKINGKEMPLDTPLKSEDQVEVMCDFELIGPRMDYTDMCKAASTKRKIKEFIRNGYKLRKL